MISEPRDCTHGADCPVHPQVQMPHNLDHPSPYPFGVKPLRSSHHDNPASTAPVDALEEAEGAYAPKVYQPSEPMKLTKPGQMRKWRATVHGGTQVYQAHELFLTEEGDVVFVVRTGPETEYIAGALARGQWQFIAPEPS